MTIWPDATCAELCRAYNRRALRRPAHAHRRSRGEPRDGRWHAWVRKGTEYIEPRPMNWGKNLTVIGAIDQDHNSSTIRGWTVDEALMTSVQHTTTFGLIPMTRFAFLGCCVLACLLAGACRGQAPGSPRDERRPFDLAATRQLIAQQNERFTKAHLTGDVAAIDAMFAPDAKSYPPGSDAVSGLPALHAFTVEYLKAGLTEFREETADFYGNAEYVVDAGTYVVTYGPDHVTERGKYLNVWQQVNGGWKIKANMWNTDLRSSTPK